MTTIHYPSRFNPNVQLLPTLPFIPPTSPSSSFLVRFLLTYLTLYRFTGVLTPSSTLFPMDRAYRLPVTLFSPPFPFLIRM